MINILSKWLGLLSLILVMGPSDAHAMNVDRIDPDRGARPKGNEIDLVAAKGKKMSAYDACINIFGQRPIRAYYRQDGTVICYYDESEIGSIKDRRKKKNKRNYNN